MKINKNLVVGLVTVIAVAFIAGWAGHLIGSLDIQAKEPDNEVKTFYQIEAENILNEEVDYVEIEGLKKAGKIKDFASEVVETETSGIYHMSVNVVMLDGSNLTVHYLYDVIDDDGFYYFTLNGTRINEDVADALYDQVTD